MCSALSANTRIPTSRPNSQARQTATGANPVKSPTAQSAELATHRTSEPVAASSHQWEDDELGPDEGSSNLSPSLQQLASLTAVPLGMVGARKPANGRTSSRRGGALVKEGAVFARSYDVAAGRPHPTNGISLLQSIRAETELVVAGFTTSTVAETHRGYSFTLTSLGFSSAYTSLFDDYKFEQIEVWIEPQAASGSTVFPVIATAVDLDDANAPTSFANTQVKQGAILAIGSGGRYHKWKPHMAVAAYSGAFTSYSNVPASWIDCNSPAVQHYGLKLSCAASTAAISYAVIARAVVTFRGPGI